MTYKEKMTALTWKMFAEVATSAGISVPQDDPRQYITDHFPYWHVFLCEVIPHPVSAEDLAENARIIASIPREEIFNAGPAYCARLGLRRRGR